MIDLISIFVKRGCSRFPKNDALALKRVDRANKDVERIDCVSMNLQGSERHLYLTVLEVS